MHVCMWFHHTVVCIYIYMIDEVPSQVCGIGHDYCRVPSASMVQKGVSIRIVCALSFLLETIRH
jgi:hypothetical protein